MRATPPIPLILFLIIFSSSCRAENELAYFCEIKSAAEVNEGGAIQEIKKNTRHWLEHYIGTTFKVVKRTGQISGEIISNQRPGVVSSKIIDRGSALQSYKILTIFGPHTSMLYVQINDYGPARGKGRYTLTGYKWNHFFTGICH
jgi:hypothetical protein